MGECNAGRACEILAIECAKPKPYVPQLIDSFYGVKVCLVGNGGCLLGSRLGKKIDDHHIVIRMNLFTVDGYEEDVGTKTDIVIMVQNEPNLRAALEDRLPRQLQTCRELWFSRPLGTNDAADSQTFVIQSRTKFAAHECVFPHHNLFWNLHHRIGSQYYPSTGLYAMIMAVSRFPQASISFCGFDWGASQHYSPAHEFNWVHNSFEEQQIFEDFIDAKLIYRL